MNTPCAEICVSAAKELSEQRGAVCLLSGGAFLSEPCWLLDANYSFVEWLKCTKEIRWGCVVVFFFRPFRYVTKDAVCKNTRPQLYSSGRVEGELGFC